MKLPTTSFNKEGRAISGTQEYNFDRCLKITLYTRDSEGKVTKSCVMEYAPLKDPKLCPRMEATINDNPASELTANQAGFTAEVTFYNAVSNLKTILAGHQSFVTDFIENKNKVKEGVRAMIDSPDNTSELEKYYANHAHIRIEAGYYNHENKTIDYGTPLFDGFVNSTVTYIEKNDEITKMYCANLDFTAMSAKAIGGSLGMCPTDVQKLAYQNLSTEDRKIRSGRDKSNWAAMCSVLCRNYLTQRPNPLYLLGSTITDISPLIPVSAADKKRNDWYEIRFIPSPNEKDNDDVELQARLTNNARLDIHGFFTNADSIYTMLNELCSYKDADVGYIIDNEYKAGKVVVFIFPRGNTYEQTKGENAEIQIVNYQNLIGVPAVDNNGCLTVRMFLNKACKPLLKLALMLDQGKGSKSTTGGDLVINPVGDGREVIGPSGGLSPYQGLIQGARALSLAFYQANARFAEANGYMFNVGFPMIKIRHELATHGNAWYTTVKTVPAYQGVNI